MLVIKGFAGVAPEMNLTSVADPGGGQGGHAPTPPSTNRPKKDGH